MPRDALAHPDAGGARRLFIGLTPDEHTRSALVAHQRLWRWDRRARPIKPAKLHMTLHFLGDVDAANEGALREVLRAVQIAPFDLTLRTVQLWATSDLAVLRPDDHAVLDDLHRHIGARLMRTNVAPTLHQWTPHVTLARHAAGSIAAEIFEPITWPVSEFALVWSRGLPEYDVLERYR